MDPQEKTDLLHWLNTMDRLNRAGLFPAVVRDGFRVREELTSMAVRGFFPAPCVESAANALRVLRVPMRLQGALLNTLLQADELLAYADTIKATQRSVA